MKIKILSPQWGHEHMPLAAFLDKIAEAGYDGIDTWLPENRGERKAFINEIEKRDFTFVAHQHSAAGRDFKAFRESFKNNLQACAEARPILINSHTGKDYFTVEQNLTLVDIGAEITGKANITITHETHRGRMGYAPQAAAVLFEARPAMEITADFSHWTCVTESMLENFGQIVTEAIGRTRHIHARVGFEQGPQISDPRAPEWAYALNRFLSWWDAIVESNVANGREVLTITTEFGPFPYMPAIPFTGKSVANQFEINCFMKDLLNKRYSTTNLTP